MKFRLKDDSFRFRITLKELECLESKGSIGSEARFPGPFGKIGSFRYGVKCAPGISGGTLVIDEGSITLVLSADELRKLKDPSFEGVYLRKEWSDESGLTHRSLAFIEKDRPSSKCDRPENWIYEDRIAVVDSGKPVKAASSKSLMPELVDAR